MSQNLKIVSMETNKCTRLYYTQFTKETHLVCYHRLETVLDIWENPLYVCSYVMTAKAVGLEPMCFHPLYSQLAQE